MTSSAVGSPSGAGVSQRRLDGGDRARPRPSRGRAWRGRSSRAPAPVRDMRKRALVPAWSTFLAKPLTAFSSFLAWKAGAMQPSGPASKMIHERRMSLVMVKCFLPAVTARSAAESNEARVAAASASAVVMPGSTGCVTAGTVVVPASVVARTGSMAASVASTSTTRPSTAGVAWKKAASAGRLTRRVDRVARHGGGDDHQAAAGPDPGRSRPRAARSCRGSGCARDRGTARRWSRCDRRRRPRRAWRPGRSHGRPRRTGPRRTAPSTVRA